MPRIGNGRNGTTTPSPSEREVCNHTSPATGGTTNAASEKNACRWRWRHESGTYGILLIRTENKSGTVTGEYFVRVTSPVSVMLEKLETGRVTIYDVHYGKFPSCGCDSFRRCRPDRDGLRSCKHVLACRALKERGDL